MNDMSFEKLHEACRDRLLNHMTRILRNRDEAEDITAAAFAAAFQNFDQFRGKSSFYTWVTAIAMNDMRSSWRRKSAVKLETLDDPCASQLMEPDLLIQALERSECTQKIRQVLRRVPAIYRRVLTDHFISGDSTRKIARQERIPQGTVLSRIFKGKRILREAWTA